MNEVGLNIEHSQDAVDTLNLRLLFRLLSKPEVNNMLTARHDENLGSEEMDCMVEFGEVSKETKGPWFVSVYDGGTGYWPAADESIAPMSLLP